MTHYFKFCSRKVCRLHLLVLKGFILYLFIAEIEMTSTDVYLKQRSGHLKCTVRGLKFYSGQISIYYQQTNDIEPKIIVMLVNDGQIYSTIFRDTPENLKISHKSKDYSVTIDLKFEEVTCFDTGLYKCELKSRGKEYTATGSLQGFGKHRLYIVLNI